MLKYLLAWLPMLLLAILNGALRDLVYKKSVGDLLAHQISTISLILLFALYIGIFIYSSPPQDVRQAWQVGLLWLLLTLLFEFGFGKASGKTWSLLLSDYNLAKGRIWILIPLWVSVAPFLFYKLFAISLLFSNRTTE